jgi:hypothetical protein
MPQEFYQIKLSLKKEIAEKLEELASNEDASLAKYIEKILISTVKLDK